MPDEAPVTSATGFLSFIGLPSRRLSVIIVPSPYDEHHILMQQKHRIRPVRVALGAGWVAVLHGRCAQGLGERGVVDRAGQHQSADHRGHSHERVFVNTRLPLVGPIPGDDIDHFLDAARGGPDDPFVGDFLAAWGGPSGGGSAHMMSIIYQSDAERKGPTPGLSVPSDTTSHWSRSNGRAL